MFQRTRRLSAVFLSALTIALVVAVGECGSAWANQEPNSQVPHWSVVSPPAIGPDGTIYVLASVGDVHLVEHPDKGEYWTSKSEHNYLYAVEPDGTQRWRSALGSGEHPPSAEFSPKIGPSGIVYVSVNRNLYAVGSNGALKWKFPFAGEPGGPPYCGRKWKFSSSENFPGDPLWLDFGANGAIYFCASNLVYALNPNGTLKWKKSTQATPMVGPDGTVYVTAGNLLYAVNPDGTQKWSSALGKGQVRALRSPQLKSGSPWTIYVVGSDNLYAVARNGAEKWKFPFTGSPDSLQLGPDGTIHFYEGKVLYALNPEGTLKWKFESKFYIYSGSRIGLDGVVYLADQGGVDVEGVGGCTGGKIYAVKPDGTLKWGFPSPGSGVGSGANSEYCPDAHAWEIKALSADGTLYVEEYVGNYGGDVAAIGPGGSEQWHFGAGNFSVAFGADGTIYVADNLQTPCCDPPTGTIYALTPSGNQKWRFDRLCVGNYSECPAGK
jgi:hypothetical protein